MPWKASVFLPHNKTARSVHLQVGAGAVQQVADPYANEPERHPALLVRTQKPFNAETPGALLAGAALTPVDLFYVRNHLPVPHIDAATHSVRALLRYTAVVKGRSPSSGHHCDVVDEQCPSSIYSLWRAFRPACIAGACL